MNKTQKNSSLVRNKKRQVRDKFMPSFESLSKQLDKTGKVTNDFIGYELPAGSIVDPLNREWQFQCRAILSKKHKMRKDEIRPMIRKWAIGLKFRAIIKYVIDWTNN